MYISLNFLHDLIHCCSCKLFRFKRYTEMIDEQFSIIILSSSFVYFETIKCMVVLLIVLIKSAHRLNLVNISIESIVS